MKMQSSIFRGFFLFMINCLVLNSSAQKGSRDYIPESWEESIFFRVDRSIFPTDIRNKSEEHKGKFVNWLGLIKDVNITKKSNTDTSILKLVVEQKYWDYIEDFSIQDEQIFLSPKGEGEFMYIFEFPSDVDRENRLKKEVENKSLGMFYGYVFLDSLTQMPILKGEELKFFDYKMYTTKIFSYTVKRNKNGDVVMKNGKPVQDKFEFLKVAMPGQNK